MKYTFVCCYSLVRGPAISGEVTVYWRIFPPSMGEFAETSGKLTMRDGQSAALVVLQVSVLLIAVMPFAVCVCGWGVGWWEVVSITEFIVLLI